MKSRQGLNHLMAVLFLSAILLAAPFAAPAMTTEAKNQILTPRTFVDLAKKVTPAVVSIKINVETRDKIEAWRRDNSRPPVPDQDGDGEKEERPNPPQFEEFPDWLKELFPSPGFPGMPDMPRSPLPMPHRELFEYPYGAGSGVLFREDGYVLTNRHVLYHPLLDRQMFKEGQITVVLHDKREFTGDQVKVVATDYLTDIAVLKIEAKNLPALKWADSNDLEIGEWVMAIGDPLELTGSISQGIVSGLEREIEIAGYPRLLQTTAIINPGNSGGPLVNLNGEIIGINMAIASDTRRWQGVGFAIPSSLARPVAEDLAEHGQPVRRGHIGISMEDSGGFSKLARDEGYEEEYGVGVKDVFQGYPAAKAGLRKNDIIVEVDGEKAKNIVAVQRLITARRPGDPVKFKVFRDGKYKTVTVIAGEWPTEDTLAKLTQDARKRRQQEIAEAMERAQSNPKKRIGLTVENQSEGSGADEKDNVVVIRQIQADRPASRAEPSLEVGDVILEVEKKPVHNVDEFAEAVRDRQAALSKSTDKKKTLLLKIRRGEGTTVSVPLP